jgi:large subunit ribosomal protein L6
MSRIGILPIKIEEGVEVKVNGTNVTITGPKGEIVLSIPGHLNAEVNDGEVLVSRKLENDQAKADHGTYRALIANHVFGVKEGYQKVLEMVGVGYRAKIVGTSLELSLGWNHPVIFEPPVGIEIEVPDETKVIIKGIDKQLVGEIAAKIRETRKPEPYKGKGIRYEGEKVRRKSPKAALAKEE